jgi:deoxyribonuclease-4
MKTELPPLGAHMSIAGGLENAIHEAVAVQASALQIFSRNNTQWAMRPIDEGTAARWREALAAHPMPTLVHDSYLINLASPDDVLYRRSRQSFLEEAMRCVVLGIPALIFHPGSHLGSGESRGLGRIARALDWVDRRLGSAPVRLLLENTAGQGTNLGHRLEHLAWILERVKRPERLGVCIDTCHLLAAGYDFRTPAGYASVFGEIDRLLGPGTVRAFHLNDSRKDLGSRVDRHEHIGKGFVGRKAFRMLLTDPRFREVPMVLETPKRGDMDRRNLALLRRLARRGPVPGAFPNPAAMSPGARAC